MTMATRKLKMATLAYCTRKRRVSEWVG